MATVDGVDEHIDAQAVDSARVTVPIGRAPVFDEYSPTTALTNAPSLSAELAALVEHTRATLDKAVPQNTRRAYEGDLRRFANWSVALGLEPLPASPATVAIYLRALANQGYKYSTIERALAAICTAHVRAGHASPWMHAHVADIRARLKVELGVRPQKKRAADEEILRQLLSVVPANRLLGLRDRAMLTIGWCAALRRSELVALDVTDVTRAPKGGVVFLEKSKTDQERHGEEVPIFFSNLSEHCPIRSLDGWLDASGIADGALFRQIGRRQELGERLLPAAVLDRVQHYAKLAGLPYRDFGAHSLRSGFATAAARHGKSTDSIQVVTRHRSLTTLLGYIQRATLHERGAGEGLL